MIPLEMWENIKRTGGSTALVAFKKVWYESADLLPEEDKVLRELFAQYPLGQDNFKVWKKQVTRQLFERSVRGLPSRV